MDEFVEKLLLKFKFSEEKAQAAIQEVKLFSRLATISKELKVVPDDPDADMVIECALVGKATHIITGDKHLLSLGKYEDILIIKATDFITLLSEI